MKVLTLNEAAEILPISERTLRRLVARGEGPFRKIGGRWLVMEDDLVDWVRTGEVRGNEPTADPMPDTLSPDSAIMELVNR